MPAVSTRLERERDFHNATFADQSRSTASKFYEVERAPMDRYAELLTAGGGPGKRVLEYGCGPGSQAFFLARGGAEVTGIDISDVAIAQAGERARAEGVAERCAFEVANAEETPFPDSDFDLVCGTAILHHLDLDAAYAEIARLIKPGGQAAFVEPLGHNPAINAYRDRTPELRTPDEHPLLVADLELARSYFGAVDVTYFNLLTLLAVPLRKTRAFDPAVAALQAVDRAIFRLPAARKHAWMVLISLSAPRPQAAGAAGTAA
jgi:SAM-dependent methyltransferase